MMNPLLALLVTLSLTALMPAPTAAQEPYRMPEVYVSASRIAGNLATSGRSVVILDRVEIERRAAHSIADLLGSLPGVDARMRGPFGVQTDIEVAGSTFSQVLILVDGVRVNDPQTGHHNLNIPLEPNDLERIEIVYGAGSAVHGPDAFGAVINLVPLETVRSTQVELASHWGETTDDLVGVGSDVAGVGTDLTIRHGWTGDRGRLWIVASKRRSDGYRTNTDFDIDRFFVRGNTAVSGGDLSLQAGLQDKEFGAQDFYGHPSKEWTKAWLYSLQYRSAAVSRLRDLTARAFYRRHRDRFVLFVSDPAFYENRHLSERAGLEGSATIAGGGWGSLLAGAEVARERIESRNLNEPRFRGLGNHGRWRLALFTEYGGRVGVMGLSSGLRFDRHERFGWEASPSIGLSYLWRQHRLFASAARAYRAPSFTEFYYEDPLIRGNPDLAAESGWSYETGIETGLVGGALLRSSVFARFENNLVDYVRADTTEQWAAMNLGEMRSVGVQLHGERSWGKWVDSQISYMWIDKEQTLAPGTLSKYVFTHPTHQLTWRIDHAVAAGISAGWQAQMKQRRGQDDYTLVDLVLSRSFSYGRSLLRIRNLTDERYEAVGGVPMPGRWLSLETQFEL